MTRKRVSFGLILAVLLVPVAMQVGTAQTPSTVGHKAAGSWFGRAVQVCPSGVAPAACSAAGPARALLMTPTLCQDGSFFGNDTLTFDTPHLTAHGTWRALSRTEFDADYAFANSRIVAFPENTVSAIRFRWQGEVFDDNTLVGWVNAHFTFAIPIAWQRLEANQFPGFPPEALPIVTTPTRFIRDPSTCRTPDCPLVFKFTIKRVTY